MRNTCRSPAEEEEESDLVVLTRQMLQVTPKFLAFFFEIRTKASRNLFFLFLHFFGDRFRSIKQQEMVETKGGEGEKEEEEEEEEEELNIFSAEEATLERKMLHHFIRPLQPKQLLKNCEQHLNPSVNNRLRNSISQRIHPNLTSTA